MTMRAGPQMFDVINTRDHMKLLDDLMQRFGGNPLASLNTEQHGTLTSEVTALIAGSGGLSGIISRFTENGLGQHVESWISGARNMPLTGEHVSQVFGHDQIQQLADKLGIDHDHATAIIAHVLPGLVDKLTPNGQMVSGAQEQEGLSGLLSQGIGAFLKRGQ